MLFSDAFAAETSTVPGAPVAGSTVATTATTTAPGTADNAGDPSVASMALPMILVAAVMYFLIIRPQQKKMKEHDVLVKGLSKGDKIVTAGGIIGIIHKVDDDVLVIEIAPDVRIRVVRDTVSNLVTSATGVANDNKSLEGK